jgi:2,3-diketo-5-methylthiopentyl-1-phosphate enolase
MAILKPGLGPSDDKIADQFGRLVAAGTDLVKDDETRIDLTLDDAQRRLEKVLAAGRGKGMYVSHLTGPGFKLRDRAIKLQAAGAQAFLFCPYTYGIGLLGALCKDPEIKVPIFAHPAFTGIMGHGPSSVSPSVLLGTLMRWAGCDAVLFPSPYGSIALPKSEAVMVHQALTRSEGALKMSASVPSAGIMPEFVAKIREDFGVDVVVNAGTGMARTGGGIEDGARAFIREIEAHYH